MEAESSDIIASRIRVLDAHRNHYRLLSELTLRAYESVEPNLYSEGYDRDLADVAGRAATAAILVAVFDDFVIGGVTYLTDGSSPHHGFDDPTSASFDHLAVDPSAQGLGAGRSLVIACIERAREDGRSNVAIRCAPTMVAAEQVFAEQGFIRDETLDDAATHRGLAYRLRLS